MGGPGTIDGKEHPETDNFQACQFQINGVTFSSVENYFQWSKATNDQDREKILKSGPGESAWEAGQQISIRDDWQLVKVQEMYNGNRAKFEQNSELRDALINTGDAPILFNDSSPFWDQWNGLIMERLRAELRNHGEKDKEKAEEIRQKMEDYAREQREK